MIWGVLITETIALIVLITMLVRSSVTISRTSTNALATLVTFDQRAHAERERHHHQVQGLVDRIMGGDWESVRLHEGTLETPVGGFLSPLDQAREEEEVDVEPVVDPDEDWDEDEGDEPTVEMRTRGGWGHVNATQDLAERLDDGQRLALEDDLDDFETDQDRRLRQARERGVVQ